ncbi:MAG TPA: hypothetical protein VMU47_23625 [Caldimonas sp.]|nr:hypothetical protein [Caldimonas sp.]
MTITILRGLATCTLATALAGMASFAARAETPGEIPKPWTYEGSMKLQEQQRQQQPSMAPGQAAPAGPRGSYGPSGGDAAMAAQWENARRNWLKQPPLPADRNPLIGSRWMRPPSTQGKPGDPFSGLMTLAKGGLCDLLFGGGVFEFHAGELVGMDPNGKGRQEFDRVEYRGDAHHVVVLPRTTVRLMEWDVEGADRIRWASQNCVLVRAGGAPSAQAAMAQPASMEGHANSSGALAGAGGVLSLSIVGNSAGTLNVANRKLWVLKREPRQALVAAGMPDNANGNALQNWIRACQSRAPSCQQGGLALKPYLLGIATTDASGHAQSPPLPAGRYWVFGDGRIDNRPMLWNQVVDVRGGPASLKLDQNNATPVD